MPRQLDHLVCHEPQQPTAFQTRQLEAAVALCPDADVRGARRGLVQAAAARPVGGRIDAKLDQIELLADAAQLGP